MGELPGPSSVPRSWHNAMSSHVLDPRRAPRVPVCCQVTVRSGRATWQAQTVELGPRGCQLVTPRLPAPGSDASLRIRCEALGRTVRAVGRVVWQQAPARVGIAFSPLRTDLGWFSALIAVDGSAARAVGWVPERLELGTVLRLGAVPSALPDLSPGEVAVLACVGKGITVQALRSRLGSGFEGLRATVFTLLARRLLVLTQAETDDPGPWIALLHRAARSLAAGGRPVPVAPEQPSSSPVARRLVEDGLAHLASGRLELAVARLEAALAAAPGDATAAGLLRRLVPWCAPQGPQLPTTRGLRTDEARSGNGTR
jgi:hypothetical protein